MSTITSTTDTTVARTNLATNPHAATATGWAYSAGGGAAANTAQPGTDTPDGRAGFFRATITTADPGGSSAGLFYRETGTIVGGLPGDVITASFYVRYSAVVSGLLPNIGFRSGGSPVGVNTDGVLVGLVVGQWVRVTVTATATTAYDGIQLWAREAVAGPAIGTTLDATMVLIERSPVVGDYFDGGSGAGYSWTGAANASISIETLPVTVTPDLVLDYAYTRTARTIVHDVLDRSDPDVTLRPVSLRQGTLALFAATVELATALDELHRTPGVLILDATPDEPLASMAYVATGQITQTWDATYDKWRLDVGYREVAA
jgi:hypothetical protein